MVHGTIPFERLFEAEEVGKDRLKYQGPKTKWPRVYGGVVISQALAAAIRTVDSEHSVHSLHAYFILPGDPSLPIEFEVERFRDGKSFSTRACRALQNGQTIFTLTASFHSQESGLEHSVSMPEVPPPEALSSFAELQKQFPALRPRPIFEYFVDEPPLEFKPIDPGRYFPVGELKERPASQAFWFRTSRPLPAEASIHQCVLAYASDMTLLDCTVISHGRSVTDGTLQPASLDHALWFHRAFRADEWLLYTQDSPNAGHGRGLAFGHIFNREGSLVASVAQEGLIRLRRK